MRYLFRFRLFPITIMACVLFIMLKVDEISNPPDYLTNIQLPAAYAAQDDEAGETETEEAPDANAEATESETTSAEVTAKEEENENPNVSSTPPEVAVPLDQRFNQIELDLLQNLTKRREEIEKYEEEVRLRENMLEATEIRLDKKINKLSTLKAELEALMVSYKKQEDSEMRSLVKIYESMKPKEAARIFNELDMPILLDVVDRMSERKAAPVLANMDPKRAKDLTVQLAELRRLRKQATNEASPEMLETQ